MEVLRPTQSPQHGPARPPLLPINNTQVLSNRLKGEILGGA